jgi:inosose dehydratase
MDIERVQEELSKNDLTIIAGTIFDDLVSESNLENLLQQVDEICSLITKLPSSFQEKGQHFQAPYLVLIDWGHEERDYNAGHPDKAVRLSAQDWNDMMFHIHMLAERSWKNMEYGPSFILMQAVISNFRMKFNNY